MLLNIQIPPANTDQTNTLVTLYKKIFAGMRKRVSGFSFFSLTVETLYGKIDNSVEGKRGQTESRSRNQLFYCYSYGIMRVCRSREIVRHTDRNFGTYVYLFYTYISHRIYKIKKSAEDVWLSCTSHSDNNRTWWRRYRVSHLRRLGPNSVEQFPAEENIFSRFREDDRVGIFLPIVSSWTTFRVANVSQYTHGSKSLYAKHPVR